MRWATSGPIIEEEFADEYTANPTTENRPAMDNSTLTWEGRRVRNMRLPYDAIAPRGADLHRPHRGIIRRR